VTSKEIYSREETETKLFKVNYQKCHIVMKFYPIDNDYKRHNFEIRFLRIFAELVIQNVCPHFILPIGRIFVCRAQIQHFFKNKPLKHNNFQILLAEEVNESLCKLLVKRRLNVDNLKSMLFQIFYTLYVLQFYFPGFSHNDLHIGNILYKQKSLNNAYKILQTTYYVDDNYEIYLWDMYFSTLGHTRLSFIPHSVTTHYTKAKSQYCDIHKLLDSLLFVLKNAPKNKHLLKNLEVEQFLTDTLPKKFRFRSMGIKNKLPSQCNYVSITQCLHNKFFDSLKKEKNTDAKLTFVMKPRIFHASTY
jgi:hypothetical protein